MSKLSLIAEYEGGKYTLTDRDRYMDLRILIFRYNLDKKTTPNFWYSSIKIKFQEDTNEMTRVRKAGSSDMTKAIDDTVTRLLAIRRLQCESTDVDGDEFKARVFEPLFGEGGFFHGK
jgi:hypothetical protein